MYISQLSKKVNIHIETIRYYEKNGLLPPPKRGLNGYRLYDDSDVALLLFIKKCRKLAFGLEEIKQLIILQKNPENHQDADLLVQKHLANIEQQQQELQAMRDFLQSLIIPHQHDSHDCPVISGLAITKE